MMNEQRDIDEYLPVTGDATVNNENNESQLLVSSFEAGIRASLNWEEGHPLDNFSSDLREEVHKVSRYQQLLNKVKGVTPKADLIVAIFNEIRRSNDPILNEDIMNTDGVLMDSIRKGKLECAGRSLVASTVMKKLGIEHTVAFGAGGGHIFLLIELDNKTMAYFDANADIYFTFPRSSLNGYQDSKSTCECFIQSFTPCENDIVIGQPNFTLNHFYSIESDEGISRSYIENVGAALAGNPEFDNSSFTMRCNADGKDIVLDSMIGAKNKGFAKYTGVQNLEATYAAMDKFRLDLLKIHIMHPKRSDFVTECSRLLQGELGKNMPYLQSDSRQKMREEYAGMTWDYIDRNNGKLDRLPRVV